MSALEVVVIVLAGMAAGTINTIVGSGSLVTFPVLLALGYPPVVANMTNTVGLVGGGVSGVWGYRRELRGTGRELRRLLPASLTGGIVGAILLLVLPSGVFEVIVPLLIALGIVLVLSGPRLQRRAALRRTQGASRAGGSWFLLVLGVFATGIYGGYFGAAQGVILMGVMGALMTLDLQVVNGIKNLLGLVVNAVSALVFVIVAGADIAWPAVGLLMAGGVAGGIIGARVGRRLSPTLLRAVIVVIGLVAIVRMLLP